MILALQTLYILEMVRITNALLIIGFIAHLLIILRNKTSSRFLLPWLLFWTTLLILYLNPFTDYTFILAILNSMFLIMASEFMLRETHEQKVWLNWSVISLGTFVLSALVPGGLEHLLPSYMSFLALAIYSGNYFRSLPGAKLWSVIMLYAYAGLNLFFSLVLFPTNNVFFYVTLLGALSVPLKIVLYYTGYVVLLQKSKVRENTQTETLNISQDPSASPKSGHMPLSPEPSVQIQFTGLWGFLYIMWLYPSGKLVVMFMFAALMAAIAFIAGNITTLLTLFRQAHN